MRRKLKGEFFFALLRNSRLNLNCVIWVFLSLLLSWFPSPGRYKSLPSPLHHSHELPPDAAPPLLPPPLSLCSRPPAPTAPTATKSVSTASPGQASTRPGAALHPSLPGEEGTWLPGHHQDQGAGPFQVGPSHSQRINTCNSGVEPFQRRKLVKLWIISFLELIPSYNLRIRGKRAGRVVKPTPLSRLYWIK